MSNTTTTTTPSTLSGTYTGAQSGNDGIVTVSGTATISGGNSFQINELSGSDSAQLTLENGSYITGSTLNYSGVLTLDGGGIDYSGSNISPSSIVLLHNSGYYNSIIVPDYSWGKFNISGFAPGDHLSIRSSNGVTITKVSVSGSTLTVTDSWGTTQEITLAPSNETAAQLEAQFKADLVNGALVCYLAETQIKTPNGNVNIEDIAIGTSVIAYVEGQQVSREVIWVGQAHCTVRPHLPDDEAGYPVRILKDAIANGVPFKDMLITAEHCLFFNGKLVPARMLVNGRSIFFDKSITFYDYYHIETEDHSIIMGDGLLTESYLDTGNRRSFQKKGNVISISRSRALTWEEDAAAPLGVSREFVEPLFLEAEARAITAGVIQKDGAPELTEDADLHLVTDTGMSIRPAREHNGRVMFMIPTGVQSVRITSNASRPSDVIGPFVDDRRYFGVAVGEIMMFESGHTHTITAHLTDKELNGWNTLEWEDTRWTSGNGLLPLTERHPNSIALLAIQVKKTGPYLLSDTVSEKIALQA